MKVALLFSGSSSHYLLSFPFYEENLFSVLKENNIEYDIFIHTYYNEKNLQELKELYKPKSLIIECKKFNNDAEAYFYGMKKALQEAMFYNNIYKRYDAYINLRFDTKIFQRFDVNNIIESIDKNTLFVNMDDNCEAQHLYSPVFYILPQKLSEETLFLDNILKLIQNKDGQSIEKYYTDILLQDKCFDNINYSSVSMTKFLDNKEQLVYNSLLYDINKKGTKPRKKLYDCFMFMNEFDILELRLNILNEFVDKFVIIEGTKTFQGNDRELLFEKNKHRFEKFLDKIEYIVCDDYSDIETIQNVTSWDYEKYQRNYLIKGLEKLNAKDDEFVMISDVDEIPNVEQNFFGRFENVLSNNGIIAFRCKLFYYYLNNIYENWTSNSEEFLFDTRITTYLTAKKMGLNELRRTQNFFSPFSNYGWHFSFIGDKDIIKNKIQSFSHIEYNTDEVLNNFGHRIDNNIDLFNRNLKFYKVYNKNFFPKYIKDNWDMLASKNNIN